MKKMNVLMTILILLSSCTIINAQKFATVDLMGILNVMPEKKKADAEIQVFLDGKQAELQKKVNESQALLEKYTTEAPTKTPAENKAREAELQKLQDELDNMKQQTQKELAIKQDAVFNPIEKKINDAVGKVATANSYDFILDTNSTVFLYKKGFDVTPEVKKELGLK